MPWVVNVAERWGLFLKRSIVRQQATAELRRVLSELTIRWEQLQLGVLKPELELIKQQLTVWKRWQFEVEQE